MYTFWCMRNWFYRLIPMPFTVDTIFVWRRIGAIYWGAECGIETTKSHPERLQEKRFAHGINVSRLKLPINLADQREANELLPRLPTQSVAVSSTFKGSIEKLIVTHLISKFIGETWLISLIWGGGGRKIDHASILHTVRRYAECRFFIFLSLHHPNKS